MTNDTNPTEMPFKRIDGLLEFIQDKDARVGLVVSLFLLVVFVVIWFHKSFGGLTAVGGFEGLIWTLGKVLLAVAAFIVFFKAIDGTVLPKVITWYFTSIFFLTCTAFWFQAIVREPTPYLIEAKCFLDPWNKGCPFGVKEAVLVLPPPLQAATGPSDPADIGEPAPRNRVFVHFAGDLARDAVIAASQRLKADGWDVKAADRGGERIAKAAGIDQVRYFHPEDAGLAKRLAREFNAKASWPGFDPAAVAEIKGYATTVPIGHLEIWTSVD